MSLQPDPQMAVDFLERLRPGGPWVLTAIPVERGNTKTRTFDSAKEMTRWIEDESVDRNIYFHINPTVGPMRKKAACADIKELAFLHVDVDPRVREDPESERVRIRRLLTEDLPPGIPRPNFIIDSGGGYWGLWRLAEPMPINGDESSYEEARLYNLKLELEFGADSCHDVARLCRLPGTINQPDEKKRAKGRVPRLATFEELGSPTYTLDEFEKAPEVRGLSRTAPPEVVKIDVANVKRVESLDELPAGVPLQTKTMISLGHDPDDLTAGKFDIEGRSGPLFHVCCELVRQGVSSETIYSIITDPDWGISESVIDGTNGRGDGYARRQIERAHEFAESPELMHLNDEYAWVESVGGACRIMRGYYDHGLEQDDVEFLKRDDFKATHNNRQVVAGQDAKGNPTYKPLGDWWAAHPRRKTYKTVMFKPEVTLPEEVYNLWEGFPVDPAEGDCSLYLEHIRENLCAGVEEHYQYLLRWMARAVQEPAVPAEVAVVLRGGKGTGKGRFAEHFGQLWGRHYRQLTNVDHVIGKFNSQMKDACLVFADEIFATEDKRHDSSLKALITEKRMSIELKGVDSRQWPNCVKLIMASNSDWVVPASHDERRYFVLDVGTGNQRDRAFFAAMEAQMEGGGYAALMKLLVEMDLSDFDHTDVPQTDALRDQIDRSLPPIDAWFLHLLEEGVLPNNWSTPQNGACPDRAWFTAQEGEGGVGLLEDAKEFHYSLRQTLNKRNLPAFLDEQGVTSPEGNGGRKSRVFPPLVELRKAWCAKFWDREWPTGDEWALRDEPAEQHLVCNFSGDGSRYSASMLR